jgi:hypothetical protein
MTPSSPVFDIQPIKAGERIKPGNSFWVDGGGTPRMAVVAELCCETHCQHYRISLITPDPQQEQTVPEPKETGAGEKLQIVEGMYYCNRKGEKIGPMKPYTNTPFVWIADGISFTSSGMYSQRMNTDYDLIAPWPDAPAPQPAEQPPSVDLWQHEREELRKANAELLEQCKKHDEQLRVWANEKQLLLRVGKQRKEEADSLIVERDQLAARCKELEQYINEACFDSSLEYPSEWNARTKLQHLAWTMRGTDMACDELNKQDDQLRTELATAKAELAKLQKGEEWRDADERDIGSVVQIKDDYDQWENRKLVAIIKGTAYPFVAVYADDNEDCPCGWKFARVRKTSGIRGPIDFDSLPLVTKGH